MDISDLNNFDLSGFNNIDELASFIRDYYYKTVNSSKNKENESSNEGDNPIESSGSGNWNPGTGSNQGTNQGESCGDDCVFGNENAEATECARKANSDVPGGFQDINPQLFNIVTVIIGTMVAQQMPFNIQNAIGNWLQLLGQSIINFNAQQQYFQGGPGRIYNPIYRNAANPFCSSASDESQSNVSSSKKKSSKVKSNNKTNIKNTESYEDIKALKNSILILNDEIKELKKEIDRLKS